MEEDEAGTNEWFATVYWPVIGEVVGEAAHPRAMLELHAVACEAGERVAATIRFGIRQSDAGQYDDVLDDFEGPVPNALVINRALRAHGRQDGDSGA